MASRNARVYESYDVRRPRSPPPLCSLQAYRTLVDYEIHKATPTICVLEPCSSQPPFFFFFSFLTVNNMPFIFFSPFSSGSHRYMPPYPPYFPSLFFMTCAEELLVSILCQNNNNDFKKIKRKVCEKERGDLILTKERPMLMTKF